MPDVGLNIKRELARLGRMTPRELRERYETVFGEPSRSGNRGYLIKRIAWRIQSLEYGTLSERAKQRAVELANDADIRLNPPRDVKVDIVGRIGPRPAADTLTPGTTLVREYKSRRLCVTVLAPGEGFEFEGERFKSLSAVAKVITGNHWNGPLFFGLTSQKRTGS